MKRNPRKLRWTKSFRKAAGKEMTVDTTLTFAARRNVPIRYNRDTMQATLHAMGRVEEIRAKRELMFYKIRMAGNRKRALEQDKKLVAENQHLLPPSERDVPLISGMADEEAMDDEMWEGLEDGQAQDQDIGMGMDVDEDSESEEELTTKSKKKSAMKTRSRVKMGVDGSTSMG
jgi:large subunit ribosomal protein L24e